jgi:hypothetical protein
VSWCSETIARLQVSSDGDVDDERKQAIAILRRIGGRRSQKRKAAMRNPAS